MGFGIRIFPGVRIRASSRGLSAGIGPRVARVHVGTRSAGFSSDLGPVSSGRRGSGGGAYSGSGYGGGYSRSSLAAYERELRRAEREEEIAEVERLEQALVAVHTKSFKTAEPPRAPAPLPVEAEPIRQRLEQDLNRDAASRATRRRSSGVASFEATMQVPDGLANGRVQNPELAERISRLVRRAGRHRSL